MRRSSAVIAFTVLCSIGSANPRQDRVSAEGTVILQMLKECSSFLEVVVVDLSTDEVASIRQIMPKLDKVFFGSELLVSTAESKPPRLLPAMQAENLGRCQFAGSQRETCASPGTFFVPKNYLARSPVKGRDREISGWTGRTGRFGRGFDGQIQAGKCKAAETGDCKAKITARGPNCGR